MIQREIIARSFWGAVAAATGRRPPQRTSRIPCLLYKARQITNRPHKSVADLLPMKHLPESSVFSRSKSGARIFVNFMGGSRCPLARVALAKAAQRDVIQSCYHRLGKKPIHLGRNDWEWNWQFVIRHRHSSFQ
jgi:hypothetical protein